MIQSYPINLFFLLGCLILGTKATRTFQSPGSTRPTGCGRALLLGMALMGHPLTVKAKGLEGFFMAFWDEPNTNFDG